mmetsp:Transcript_12391/g.34358  ORF Transcript_12391/g.34358 Transcript_12391/m.34358 type:complete len:89 (+) Transcript_12391:773-1039(+)
MAISQGRRRRHERWKLKHASSSRFFHRLHAVGGSIYEPPSNVATFCGHMRKSEPKKLTHTENETNRAIVDQGTMQDWHMIVAVGESET